MNTSCENPAEAALRNIKTWPYRSCPQDTPQLGSRMATTVLAVSGGIDSMTLMWLYHDRKDVIVAHFNHGTRPSADEDEAFVRRVAERYGLKFISEKANLGQVASEAEAREARYRFLNRVAKTHNGKVYVAHHSDDVIESIAINLLRGTGWRGLAVMGNYSVIRPLLSLGKKSIYQLAATESLTFRQDPTNAEDFYLRNRVRRALRFLPEDSKAQLKTLYQRQNDLAHEIDQLVAKLLPIDHIYQRAWFDDLDESLSLEILRAALLKANISATRPQILDFLQAIRTYAPEKSFNLPGNHLIKLHKTYFML